VNSYKKIKRLYETTKHLSGRQIAHRIRFIGKRKIAYPFRFIHMAQYIRLVRKNVPVIRMDFSGLPNPDSYTDLMFDSTTLDVFKRKVKAFNLGSFTFLNKTHVFSGALGWNDSKLSHLWRYNLHYFDYAVEMGCYWRLHLSDLNTFSQFKRYVMDWIEHNNRLGVGDGWHPYTISLRLVNWAYAYELFKPLFMNDSTFRDAFTESYFIQSLFLYRNLEWDVMGNHLIENGRALVFSGLFLEHPLALNFLNKGLSVLWGQIHEQILDDGCHYERTPMYHQIVLRDYLEVIQILRLNGKPVPAVVTRKVKDMINFLNQVLHPDGDIPLFNDSAFGIASSPGTLRIQASNLGIGEAYREDKLEDVFDFFLIDFQNVRMSSVPPTAHFKANESGYYVYRSSKVFLIADAGDPSPDFLPAHAHADFGSYELSFLGNRWIIDSGIYQYQGEERNIFRGTSSHNCLTLNGENQTDVYGSFRMARRAKPVGVENSILTNMWALKARHNGYQYKNLFPIRFIFVMNDRMIVIVDELLTSGSQSLESYIHFDPDVKLVSQGVHFTANRDGQEIRITPFSSGDMINKLVPGCYSPKFNVKLPNTTIKMEMQVGHGKHFIGYVIALDDEIESIESIYNQYKIYTEDSITCFSYQDELFYETTSRRSRP
jgi:hypothetical protein